MKKFRFVLSIFLASILLASSAITVSADAFPSAKEEVVYVGLAADGAVKDIYTVNIFDGGDITDYGSYSSVELLNTTDKISQNGDMITFSTSADRVYYKGKMKTTSIPWNISIRYYIDGTEYSPCDAAGKSGNLEIRFKITENKLCAGNFYENYALQANFTLDTQKCSNITAYDATIANVGSDKQISYTILPGEGIDTVITAKVTDFEMDSVSINGIPLSMNIEVDDSELMDKVNELLDAIAELDDGASELSDGSNDLWNAVSDELCPGVNDLNDGMGKFHEGIGELKDGSKALSDGTLEIKNGASDLDTGIKNLNSGIALIQSGLTELNGKSESLTVGSGKINNALRQIQTELDSVTVSAEQIDYLVMCSAEIKNGINALSDSVDALYNNVSYAGYKDVMSENNLDIDLLLASNEQTINELSNQMLAIENQITYLRQMGANESRINELQASYDQLDGIVTLLKGNTAAINGMEVYLTQINSTLSTLSSKTTELKNYYDLFDTGINTLASEFSQLMLNMQALKTGINTLVTEYGKLDSGIKEYTDGVAAILAGYSEVSDGFVLLLDGSSNLKTGASTLYDKTGELISGITDIYTASGELKSGSTELSTGIQTLLDSVAMLDDGINELKTGTGDMREETDGLDLEISDRIDEMIANITGGNTETVSFVSDKNTNIRSVQFVIKTDSVEKEKVEVPPANTTEKLNFWQKLLRLFGLY
ncbi:MAG: hypothetical protein ACI4EW_02155 [Butyrivibrio sp.]